MSERAEIRAQLREVLRTDDAVDEFLVDYFRDIAAKRSTGMTRDQKITLLIEAKEIKDIRIALQKFNCPDEPIDSIQRRLDTGAEEIVTLRQENDRLRRTIQELEQQIALRAPDTFCTSRAGLEQIIIYRRTLDQFFHPKSVAKETDWDTWVYTVVHVLEKYFGKYHQVTSDFRYMGLIEKLGPADKYKVLLDAAISIMSAEVNHFEQASNELELSIRSHPREPSFY